MNERFRSVAGAWRFTAGTLHRHREAGAARAFAQLAHAPARHRRFSAGNVRARAVLLVGLEGCTMGRTARRAAIMVLALASAACGGGDDAEDVGDTGEALARPATVLPCVDPGLTRDGAQWIAFCGGVETRFWTSDDLGRWTEHEMHVVRPAWASPESAIGGYQPASLDGKRYVYFSVGNRHDLDAHGNPHKAMGVFAVPDDGFRAGMTLHNASDAVHDAPLIAKQGESVQDAFPLQDGDHLYVYYNQFSGDKHDSGVYVNEMESPPKARCCQRQILRAYDSAAGEGTRMRKWTGTTVEAPAVVRSGGFYYVFFSGNLYSDARYGTGVARSVHPTSGFEEYPVDRDSGFFYPQLSAARMKSAFKKKVLLGPGEHQRLGGSRGVRRAARGRGPPRPLRQPGLRDDPRGLALHPVTVT
jgi:hypothetical protein